MQPETKRIFFTDVGGSAFEEVNELIAGGNYGWPRAEGLSTSAALRKPLHAYSPLVGQSIVGGVFLPRDSPWPQKWRGKFVFGDFMKHWIKALDPESPTNVVTFARGLNGPVATESAPDGSLLVLNRGTIWRDGRKFAANAGSLVRIRYAGSSVPVADRAAPAFTPALGLPADPAKLPRTLTRADWEKRTHNAKPVSLHTRIWQPPAQETAHLYLPAGTPKNLPPGAAVVRHFRIENRLIETRIVVIGDPRGYGVSYRWRSSELAELVEDGQLESFKASSAWWFPGLEDGLTVPITSPAYWFSIDLNEPAADWQNPETPLEARVRSYLHGNCAVCHQPGGASRGAFDARITTPLDEAGIINGPLAAGDLGIPGAKIVVPGEPDKSILYRRLKAADFFRMPPVQYHNEPSPILPVMEQWIRSLGGGAK